MNLNIMQKHLLEVTVTNAGALAITLANLNAVLSTISLSLAIGYTIFRIVKDLTDKK